MKYNSEERLIAWKERGEFPNIHDDLFDLIQSRSSGGPYLDLCCSTGLLGVRLIQTGELAWGVECNQADGELRRRYGVPLYVYDLRVTRKTVGDLGFILRNRGIRSVVARRCISELFASDRSWGGRFVKVLEESGVLELFVQGRRVQPNATHPIPDVHAELDVLSSPHLRTILVSGELAFCRVVPSDGPQ